MKIANWQLATPVFYKMKSLDNDPIPLLGHTDVTCCSRHVCVCVLECDPHVIGIAVSYCFVLHFCASNRKFVFSACLLLSVFDTRLMRPNKVETGRGLLT